ncbi:MAG: hypothetical protein IPF82_16250 [Blastocatellia bacterium]|nr:hypothetical protein [Blastocatellia bacterium]
MNDYITKPVRPEDLQAALERSSLRTGQRRTADHSALPAPQAVQPMLVDARHEPRQFHDLMAQRLGVIPCQSRPLTAASTNSPIRSPSRGLP